MSFEGTLGALLVHSLLLLGWYLLCRWHLRVATEIWEGMKGQAEVASRAAKDALFAERRRLDAELGREP